MGEGVGEGPGPEAIGRAEFPAGASNQISLMKWRRDMKPDGTETKGIRALRFLKPPPCGFPWVVDHFISEIADCTQQPEIPPSLWPPAPALLPPFPHALPSEKIDGFISLQTNAATLCEPAYCNISRRYIAPQGYIPPYI